MTQRDKKNVIWIMTAIFILAAPALAMRILTASNDGYKPPLAITEESNSIFVGRTTIDVLVEWGADCCTSLTQDRLRDVIATTLEAQTDLYTFDFRTVTGSEIAITFTVDGNTYGPVQTSQVATELDLAMTDLRLSNRRID